MSFPFRQNDRRYYISPIRRQRARRRDNVTYNIANSLRLRAANSATITRTPAGAGNRRTWTWSAWIKRGTLSVASGIFGANAGGGTSTGIGTDTFGGATGDKFILYFNGNVVRRTTAVYRDPTAWYHVVLATDTTQATAGNRHRLYVNGAEVTTWDVDSPIAQNTDGAVNNNVAHALSNAFTLGFFDGYMAEVILVDGSQLTPSSFGQIDATTGAWVPKRYTGTYGTNGFYLPFNDAASTTTISQDRSGNGNNWTSSGISVTAGPTFDQMTDTPTNNFAVLSPIISGSPTPGNANLSTGNSISQGNAATFTMTTGKWYWEVTCTGTTGGWPVLGCAQHSTPQVPALHSGGYGAATGTSIGSDGSVYNGAVGSVASFTTNDVLGFAFDADTGRLFVHKNGTWQNSGNPAAGTGQIGNLTGGFYTPTGSSYNGAPAHFNFGQRAFTYTPPTGFNALNTKNLPAPVNKKPSTAFSAVLDTGANIKATSEALFSGSDFLELIKDRANSNNWQAIDTVRGTSAVLQTNTAAAETTYSAPSGNSVGYVWKRGAQQGFDIVTFTGDGSSGRTVAHGLGATPHFMLVKRRDGIVGWAAYHRNQNATPQNYSLVLNSSAAAVSDSAAWNNTAPTGSVITLGNGSAVNTNTGLYVAYLWTEVPGFSRFGSYTGNGAADGPFVWCGFKPRFILRKRIDDTSSWNIIDSARTPFNLANANLLYPDLDNSEYASASPVDVLSNGFKMRDAAGMNAAGATYIFAAFAEAPFKYATAR